MGRKDKAIALENFDEMPIGMRLRYARQSKQISLTDMATLLKYTKGYLSGVENGNIRVSEELVRHYEEALQLVPGELDELMQVHSKADLQKNQQPWYVSYQRNLFFTGREELFENIRHRLLKSSVVPRVLAITGLGGIGKTQLTVEYAYRYRHEYQAVLWLNASSLETLIESCVELANHLDLPEKGAKDRHATLLTIQRWLRENPHCLIVLDNVDNPLAVTEFLQQVGESHIILTTRMQAVGVTAQTLELGELNTPQSILLLLRRAKIISLDSDLSTVSEATLEPARAIAEKMAGLPLALNQAGSYIEETGCGLAGYLHLLEGQEAKMLKETDQVPTGYHTSVATTWTLSFEKIKQTNPAAADLLYLCAFLHPDKIYEEFIIAGAELLGPVLHPVAADPFMLHRAVGELRKYSLVRTDPASGALSIHRLVQVVIQDALDQNVRRQWAERTVKAANHAFPLLTVAMWHETWSTCQRYFPQVEACIPLIQQWTMLGIEITELLHKMGVYLEARTEFQRAERMYQQALRLDERFFHSREHSAVVRDLSSLAHLYQQQKKYVRAEELYREALFIQDQLSGLEHFDVLLLKNYIGLLHKMERKHEAAELRQQMNRSQFNQQELMKRIPVNDDDKQIKYSKDGWVQQKHQGNFNSDSHYTNTPGASFQYDFTGVGIQIVADTSSAHGEVEIYIDKVYMQTVNTLRITNQLTQTIIFSNMDLDFGPHRLEAVLVNGVFIVDALAVFSYDEVDANLSHQMVAE